MKFMKRIMQGILTAGLVVLGLGVVQKVQAVNPDNIAVTVTATGANYGVHIDSTHAGGYAFGSVALGATTNSTVGIPVTNTGTISEYFTLAVSSTTNGGVTKWAPVSGAPGQDQFGFYGYFASSTTATPPATTVFDSTTNVLFNLAANGHNFFGQDDAAYGGGFTGRTPPTAQLGSKRFLWLQLKMPSDITDSANAAQTMILTVNGQGT